MAKSQRLRKLRKSTRTWDAPALPWILGAMAGLFAALAVSELQQTVRGMAAFGHEGTLAPLWAFLFGMLAVALPILTIQKATLRVIEDLRAYINIRPLTGQRLLGSDAWAMDAVFAENVARTIIERPGQVVELGSGHSSVLIAQRLAHLGQGHLTSLDHLEAFADRTRGWLAEQGLEAVARVVHAPIADHEIDGATYPWYSMDALEDALPQQIDVLVVDGPPAKIGRDARWPAVPLLESRLAPDALILMDDGDRPDETRIARAWHQRLGGELRYLAGGKGGWLIRRG